MEQRYFYFNIKNTYLGIFSIIIINLQLRQTLLSGIQVYIGKRCIEKKNFRS